MTVDEVIAQLPGLPSDPLPAPCYAPPDVLPDLKLGLAVESMRRHTTDEGWQVFQGLEANGWKLAGRRLPINNNWVPKILEQNPCSTLLLQDKREWHVAPNDFRDQRAFFHDVPKLALRPDIFKLTILKDSQQRPGYHRESASEMGCHAWVIYYHPRIVARLAPYVRPQHLIRTYHSVNPQHVPSFSQENRAGVLLSGALGVAYPLRTQLVRMAAILPETTVLKHPGYHKEKCHTPEFLKTLSQFKVAICTASRYGYALRKMVEATAAGCVVVTDLPRDEVMPEIDGNLYRVEPGQMNHKWWINTLRKLLDRYDPERQRHYADLAKRWYDFKAVTKRLSDDIEAMRRNYDGTQRTQQQPESSVSSVRIGEELGAPPVGALSLPEGETMRLEGEGTVEEGTADGGGGDGVHAKVVEVSPGESWHVEPTLQGKVGHVESESGRAVQAVEGVDGICTEEQMPDVQLDVRRANGSERVPEVSHEGGTVGADKRVGRLSLGHVVKESVMNEQQALAKGRNDATKT